MSKTLNEWFSHLEVVAAQLRRNQFLYDGIPLEGRNASRIADTYLLWYAIMVETLTASLKEQPRSFGRLVEILRSTDVRDLLRSCKEADALLLQSIEIGWPDSYDSFKRCLKEQGFVVRLVGEVKGLITEWFESMEPHKLLTLRDFFLFPTKVHLRLESLKEEALEEYVLNESNLSEITPTSEEAEIISRWFPTSWRTWFEEHIVPQHGSGSVAEGPLLLYEKYGALGEDSKLRYLRIRSLDDRLHLGPITQEARVTFVPKTFNGYRTISMEPAARMFWQEGVWYAFKLMLRAKDSPARGLRKRYDPKTQEPNRELAQYGSIDGSYTTIDLHAASDSVRWSLIQAWFSNSCLYRALFCTRTSRAKLPDGTSIPLKKFAPMGSAVNFMVECIVFAAITEAAICEYGGDPKRSAFRVYGDDIVVETKYAPAVIKRLERNGFTVNLEKTFQYGAKGFFRESCGGHYLDCENVTPCVISRKFEAFSSRWLSPSTISAMIDQCNAFYKRHYRLARGVLLHRLLELPQRLQPAFGHNSSTLLSDTENLNFQLNQRKSRNYWDDKTQKTVTCNDVEVQHGCLISPKRSQRRDEELEEFLRRTYGREQVYDPCEVDTAQARKATKWGTRWSPTFILEGPDVDSADLS